MQVKTLLNRVHPVKGFVYEEVQCVPDPSARNGCRLDVRVRPHKNSRGVTSCCGKRAPTYDHLKPRRFAFVPLWGMAVVLVYAMRRLKCPACGTVRVEQVPWAAQGKKPMSLAFMCFLAGWAKRMSWKQTAEAFDTSWSSVYRAVCWMVEWGLPRRNLSGILAIGVDEISRRKGQVYLTLVYQIDAHRRRLLFVADGRRVRALLRFFKDFGPERTSQIRFVCSDMWQPYLKVIRKKVPWAMHILDRFHIVKNLNDALNEIRAQEHKKLEREGYEPVLKKTRWCFLKRRENLTQKEKVRLRDVLKYDLRSVRAYLRVSGFHAFWEYTYPAWAAKFFDAWCADVMRSRLEPLKRVARSMRRNRELILNWFRARKELSSGIVEGFNGKAKVAARMAYGFRTFGAAEASLYHRLGDLPEPELAHRFW